MAKDVYIFLIQQNKILTKDYLALGLAILIYVVFNSEFNKAISYGRNLEKKVGSVFFLICIAQIVFMDQISEQRIDQKTNRDSIECSLLLFLL